MIAIIRFPHPIDYWDLSKPDEAWVLDFIDKKAMIGSPTKIYIDERRWITERYERSIN